MSIKKVLRKRIFLPLFFLKPIFSSFFGFLYWCSPVLSAAREPDHRDRGTICHLISIYVLNRVHFPVFLKSNFSDLKMVLVKDMLVYLIFKLKGLQIFVFYMHNLRFLLCIICRKYFSKSDNMPKTMMFDKTRKKYRKN